MFESLSTSHIPQAVRFSERDQELIKIAFNELNAVSPALFPERLCNGKVQILNNNDIRLIVEQDNGKGFRFFISFKTQSFEEAKFTTAYFKLREGNEPAIDRIVCNQEGRALADEIFSLLEENGVNSHILANILLCMEPGQLKNIIDTDTVRINVQRTDDGKFFFTKRKFGKEWTPIEKSAEFSINASKVS